MVGTLAGSVLAGRVAGGLAGAWASNRIPGRPLRVLNRLLGGLAGLFGVIATVWVTTPVLAVIPGWPSKAVRGSLLSAAVDRSTPDGLSARQAVERLFADARIPSVIPTSVLGGISDGISGGMSGERNCEPVAQAETQNECPAEAKALVEN